MIRVLLLAPDNDDGQVRPQVVEIENNLEGMQQMIGGYIEMVLLRSLEANGIIDEEGKIKHLPVNTVASMLVELRPGDWIAGPMVITGPTDSDGEFTSVDDDLVAAVFARTGWEQA